MVATPIGNLEDITLRAMRILKEVDLIASEDTRHTKKLLSHLDIRTPLFSYYREKEQEKAELLVEKMLAGKNVALVSDAGTPGISDPGAVLVNAARQAGIPIVPVPGPAALTAALSVSGLLGTAFAFYGFLPSSKGRRRKFLQSLVLQSGALVFYESPKRIIGLLKDCLDILGDRSLFVARELTKLHEETLIGDLSEIIDDLSRRTQIKGEFVVIITGADIKEKPQDEDFEKLLVWYKKSGSSLKDAVKTVTADLGLSRSAVYQKALKIWGK